jgi:ankyrin repeat protein
MQSLEQDFLNTFEKLSLVGETAAANDFPQLVNAAAQGNLHSFCTLLDTQPHLSLSSADPFSGMTPFIAAAKNGHFNIIEEIVVRQSLLLIDGNDSQVLNAILALADAIDNKGNTALHYACMNDYIEIVDYLISMGANTLIENCQGLTAAQMAKSCELRCLFFETVYEEHCGVCLESFSETPNDIAGHFYMCGHVFHLGCVCNHHCCSKSLSVCPYCRAEKRPIRLVQQVLC